MAKPGSVIGWLLAEDDRERLLQEFPPKFDKTVAHHVTLKSDAEGDPLPAEPPGRIDHITWSLGEGRRARESNDVLKERGWAELDHPIPVKLTPGRI